MVKRQKEKQYLSAREQKLHGQARAANHHLGTVQRRLPFDYCALSLVPFETPCCTTSSCVVFDNAALMEFVLAHKRDPVTGGEILRLNASKDVHRSTKITQIIRLHMDRDAEHRWQCPVLTKPFSDRTKIVAVVDRNPTKSDQVGTLEAWVYSYEAYDELNVKTKNWFDLTTGKKFSPKKDVFLLNDPENEVLQQQRDIQGFWHIQNARSLGRKDPNGSGRKTTMTNTSSSGGSSSINSSNVRYSVTVTRVMEQINKERKETENRVQQHPVFLQEKDFFQGRYGREFHIGQSLQFLDKHGGGGIT